MNLRLTLAVLGGLLLFLGGTLVLPIPFSIYYRDGQILCFLAAAAVSALTGWWLYRTFRSRDEVTLREGFAIVTFGWLGFALFGGLPFIFSGVLLNPIDAVFPTRNGTWQQVNNVERRWRQIRADTGLDWVTPHTFRKTVATLISERVDAETASQQLGHSSPAITREFYISKPAIAADVAHVLDELAGPETGDPPNTSGISGE